MFFNLVKYLEVIIRSFVYRSHHSLSYTVGYGHLIPRVAVAFRCAAMVGAAINQLTCLFFPSVIIVFVTIVLMFMCVMCVLHRRR